MRIEKGGELTILEEALNHPLFGKQWEYGVLDKYNSHIKNRTWILVKLSDGQKAIASRWVLKDKTDEEENVTRFNMRIIKKRYTQIYRMDYLDTFALVIKPPSI